MAKSYNNYTGPGPWTVSFPYLDQSHVHIYVDGVEVTTGITWPTTGTVTITPDPAANARIFIKRQTPDTPLVEFTNRVAINELNLNTANLQTLYRSVEAADRADLATEIVPGVGVDFGGLKGFNAADPTEDQDVVTKAWAETTLTTDVAAVMAAKTAAETAASSAQAIVDGAVNTVTGELSKFMEFSPLEYNAVGDGVADDTAAINACIAAARNTYDATTKTYRATIDLNGQIYRCNDSIDLSMFRGGYQVVFRNGTILSHATGKIALNLRGSRGVHLADLVIVGDDVDTPNTGLFLGRYSTGVPGGGPAASEHLLTNVRVTGTFDLTAIHNYASETNNWVNVLAENNKRADPLNPTVKAYAYIGEGVDNHTETSDPLITTGVESNIMQKTTRLKAARVNNPGTTVTGISFTGGQTIVSYTGADPEEGFALVLWGIVGPDELNDIAVTPVAIDTVAKTVTLDIDGSGYDAYVSGGVFSYKTGPAVYLSSLSAHHHESLYCISYGDYPIEIEHSGSGDDIRSLWIDCHCEGAGMPALVFFKTGNNELRLVDFKFQEHNSHAIDHIFATDASGASGKVVIENADIRILNFQNEITATSRVFDPPQKYQFNGKSFVSIGEKSNIRLDEFEFMLNPPSVVELRDSSMGELHHNGTPSPGHIQSLDTCQGMRAVATGANQSFNRGFLSRVGSSGTSSVQLIEGTGVRLRTIDGTSFTANAVQIRSAKSYVPANGAISLVAATKLVSQVSARWVLGFAPKSSVNGLLTSDVMASLDSVGNVSVVDNDAFGIIYDATAGGNWRVFARKDGGTAVATDLGIAPTSTSQYWRIVGSIGEQCMVFYSTNKVDWEQVATVNSAFNKDSAYAGVVTGELSSGTAAQSMYLNHLEVRGNKVEA